MGLQVNSSGLWKEVVDAPDRLWSWSPSMGPGQATRTQLRNMTPTHRSCGDLNHLESRGRRLPLKQNESKKPKDSISGRFFFRPKICMQCERSSVQQLNLIKKFKISWRLWKNFGKFKTFQGLQNGFRNEHFQNCTTRSLFFTQVPRHLLRYWLYISTVNDSLMASASFYQSKERLRFFWTTGLFYAALASTDPEVRASPTFSIDADAYKNFHQDWTLTSIFKNQIYEHYLPRHSGFRRICSACYSPDRLTTDWYEGLVGIDFLARLEPSSGRPS